MMAVSARGLAALFAAALLAGAAPAQEEDGPEVDLEALEAERRENLEKWTVGSETAERLNHGLELLEEERHDEAREKVERIALRRANPRERALVHRVLAFVAVGEEDFDRAITEFEKVLEQEALLPSDESGIRFNIVQLNAVQQEWEAVLSALEEWFRFAADPNPLAYYLKAMAYYQLDRLDEALAPARKAVEIKDEPREPWLQLLAALHLAKQDYASATPVLEELVTRFPKKTYWVQLSLIYGQLENYRESLAVQQLAYRQGLLTEDRELRRLARTYLYQGLPYQAARVLEQGLASRAIEEDPEVLELLGNSWIAARHFDRSVAPLEKAAALAEDGELFVRLGQLHIRREQWEQAQEQLRRGVEKGGLEDPAQAELLMGIALHGGGEPDRARGWLERAMEDASTRGQASAWIDMLDREQAAAATESEQPGAAAESEQAAAKAPDERS